MSANERRKYERAKDPLRAMHERARDAGTECLATEWLGCSHHYRFRCPLGNEWLRTSNLQRRNARCLRCSRAEAGLAQRDAGIFDRIVQAAIDRGGACQTSNYQGAYARYNFVCASGHNWDAPAYHVLSGTWCRQCAYASRRGIAKTPEEREKVARAKRLSDGLERLQALAASHEGVCLSNEYVGSSAKYPFRCAKGHEFEVLGSNVCRSARGAEPASMTRAA